MNFLKKVKRIFSQKYFLAFFIMCSLMGPVSAEDRGVNEILNAYRQKIDSQTIKEKTYRLDGKEYYKVDLIRDFLETAFSNSFWNQDKLESYPDFVRTLSQSYEKNVGIPSEDYRSNELWLSPFFKRTVEKLPKVGLLSRWQEEVTIGIDWPVYRRNGKGKRNILNNFVSIDSEKFYALFEEEIRKSIDELSFATGLKITLVAPGDPREETEGFAKLRVIPVQSSGGQFFKMFRPGAKHIIPHQTFDTGDFEYALLGAVPFSPPLRAQVEGYFIPNEKNVIELAICKIRPDVGDALLGGLIRECLARALGLPNVSSNDYSLIGSWNKAFEKRADLGAGVSVYNIFDKSFPTIDKEPFPSERVNESSIPPFTQYDQAMLKLLYCDVIKPGMDKNQAFLLLLNNNSCFEKGQIK